MMLMTMQHAMTKKLIQPTGKKAGTGSEECSVNTTLHNINL